MTLRNPSLPNNGQPLALGSEHARGDAAELSSSLKGIVSKLKNFENSSMDMAQRDVWTEARKLVQQAISKLAKMPD